MKKKLCLPAVFVTACQVFALNFADGFTEIFDGYAQNQQPNNFRFGSGGQNQNTWLNGAESDIEEETKTIKLAMVPENAAGPWQGPNFTSKQLTLFGRYSARIKIPSVESQPNVGGVVGFYTYYNDIYNDEQEKDQNSNGLNDNSEIDFEWLIANPQLVYLTAWTDYEENGSCRKIARIVNPATGQILTTNYSTQLGSSGTRLTGVENIPSAIPIIPNFDASQNFYTYGFDWKSDNIRWWIINPYDEADTIVLWDYRGNTDRITQKPAFLMFNFWHTNDWAAEGKPQSKQAPVEVFWAEFDFIKYELLSDIEDNGGANPIARQNTVDKKTLETADAAIVNGRLNLRVLADANNADIALYDLRGRLLFERSAALSGNFASIALPKQIIKKQAAILRIKTNNGLNLTKRILIKGQ